MWPYWKRINRAKLLPDGSWERLPNEPSIHADPTRKLTGELSGRGRPRRAVSLGGEERVGAHQDGGCGSYRNEPPP